MTVDDCIRVDLEALVETSPPLSRPQSRIETSSSPQSGRSSLSNLPSPNLRQKRQYIANEILGSERNYLAILNDIQRLFVDPLRANGIISAKNITDLFSNIGDIIKINTELLSMLTERMMACPSDLELCLGDIFLYLGPFLKIYSVYVRNYQNAIRLAAELERKNNLFAIFLQNLLKSAECAGRGLQAYILAPVQRIPRYKLLLDDLLKHTATDHPDYDNLCKALSQIESVANFVNEMIREHEGTMQMLELQRSLSGYSGELIKPGRKLLKQGILVKICRKTNKPRVMFLFSDMLIYAAISRSKTHVSSIASPKSRFLTNSSSSSSVQAPTSSFLSGGSLSSSQQSFNFHRQFSLNGMQIVSVKDSDAIHYCFQIKSAEKSFAVLCASEKEKQAWMDSISLAIENLLKNRSTLRLDCSLTAGSGNARIEQQAPVWVPDNATLTCMCCAADFSMVRRRHHCRWCGHVVCGNCSSQKLPAAAVSQSSSDSMSAVAADVPEGDHVQNLVRVCDNCYAEYRRRRKRRQWTESGDISPQDKNYLSDSSENADDDDQEAMWIMRKRNLAKQQQQRQSRQLPVPIRQRLVQPFLRSLSYTPSITRKSEDTSSERNGDKESNRDATRSSLVVDALNGGKSISSMEAHSTMEKADDRSWQLRMRGANDSSPSVSDEVENSSDHSSSSPRSIPFYELHESVASPSLLKSRLKGNIPATENITVSVPPDSSAEIKRRCASFIGVHPLPPLLALHKERPRSITDIQHGLSVESELRPTASLGRDFCSSKKRQSSPNAVLSRWSSRLVNLYGSKNSGYNPWITDDKNWRPRKNHQRQYQPTPFAQISELTLRLAIAGLRPTRSNDNLQREINRLASNDYHESNSGDRFRSVLKEGYLMKRGKRFKSWKSRWVILSPLHICWYKPDPSLFNQSLAPLDRSPCFMGSLPLLECIEVGYATTDEVTLPTAGHRGSSMKTSLLLFGREETESSPFPDLDPFDSADALFPFKFVTPWRTLYMVAASGEERDEWLLRLTKAVKDAIILVKKDTDYHRSVAVQGEILDLPPLPASCPPTPPIDDQSPALPDDDIPPPCPILF